MLLDDKTAITFNLSMSTTRMLMIPHLLGLHHLPASHRTRHALFRTVVRRERVLVHELPAMLTFDFSKCAAVLQMMIHISPLHESTRPVRLGHIYGVDLCDAKRHPSSSVGLVKDLMKSIAMSVGQNRDLDPTARFVVGSKLEPLADHVARTSRRCFGTPPGDRVGVTPLLSRGHHVATSHMASNDTSRTYQNVFFDVTMAQVSVGAVKRTGYGSIFTNVRLVNDTFGLGAHAGRASVDMPLTIPHALHLDVLLHVLTTNIVSTATERTRKARQRTFRLDMILDLTVMQRRTAVQRAPY